MHLNKLKSPVIKVAAMEGAAVADKVFGKLPNLSEMQVVECSHSNKGCVGGDASLAYADMMKHKMGLEHEWRKFIRLFRQNTNKI